ncbi:DNA repair protein RadA [soil metagenome]
MVKLKKTSSFVCQECGYDTASWLGKCPECGLWNSFKEIKVVNETSSGIGNWASSDDIKPQKLQDIAYSEKSRIQSGYLEMDTVLGGGIVRGSVILLAGDPGVGKSTLLLQLCLQLANQGKTILYISGEESVEQIKLRAERIQEKETKGKTETKVSVSKSGENLYLVALSNPDSAVVRIEELKPDLVIVDSIQTMQSGNVAGLSGSVGQVRYAALHYVRVAKSLNIPIILVGHVTKEGTVAGPMVLSHMVDTVLFLEGEKFAKTRILRSFKNRFGPVDEVGIFQMEETGMREITDTEHMFLTKSTVQTPGSVLVATLEGTRAFLVELQALVVYSKLAMPRRVVSGLDQRRVELLLAVLQKHCRLPVETMDVFVNVAGGLKLSDPGIDLGICIAIVSSLKNIPTSQTVGIGEIGLLGELRSVSGIEKRVKEAQKLGFSTIITPQTHKSLVAVLETLGNEKK